MRGTDRIGRGDGSARAAIAGSARRARVVLVGGAVLLVALAAASPMFGRYPIEPAQAVAMLVDRIIPLEQTWTDQQATLFFNVRLPRILLAALVGCGLSASGAAYQGSVKIDGRELRELSIRERSRLISYIPQAHSSVYDYSVLDVVVMSTAGAVGILASPSAAQVARAWDALERVGIARLAHRPATQISGGEQQLVLIARALAQDARTIVMDEPTSALDYGNTVRVLTCIRQLAREGYAIVQSTHQPDQAFLFADRVLVLADGGVRAFGAPADVITEDLVADIYGVDVRICSLFGDRVRVCVPVDEIDNAGEPATRAGQDKEGKDRDEDQS